MDQWQRFARAILLLALVFAIGTVGYLILGFEPLNAVYQTVTTVATVGFREVEELTSAGKIFTMVLIIGGVGVTLYAFGVLIETLIEGRLRDQIGKRRMQRTIDELQDHIVICGWGRVGRSIASEVSAAGRTLVVVDHDEERLAECPHLQVHGDAADDQSLIRAGVQRASSLVAAVDTDAANSFITLSARALVPGLFIVTRARSLESEQKLTRAGADRVVNPQNIGGARMAAFVLRPHVAEFLDVVVHEHNLEFRLEELTITDDSPIAGISLRDAHIRDRTGALVLALRNPDGVFNTNPAPETLLVSGEVLIAIGTEQEQQALAELVNPLVAGPATSR